MEVRYDIWDSSKVYVWSMDGKKICTAGLDDHAVPYMPKTRREVADDKRRKAQLGRLEDKAQRIAPGATIMLPAADQGQYSDELAVGRQAQPVTIDVEAIPAPSNTRPLFLNRMHHYRWLMEHRDQCNEADESWLAEYAQDPEYLDMADRYEFEKIAYSAPIVAKEAVR